MTELFKYESETDLFVPVTEDEIFAVAEKNIYLKYTRLSNALNSPDLTKKFLQLHFANEEREHLAVIFLDNQNRVLVFERMFSGTIDAASIYPREIVKAALLNNAKSIIITHNHPSGAPEPSTADRRITERIKSACELVDIKMLDHFVIAGNESVSFAERGWI